MITNTKLVSVPGTVFDGEGIILCNMVVRLTSTEEGETISISADDQLEFTVPFKLVDDLIRRTREARP